MRAYKVGQDRFTSGPMAFHSASGIVAFENEDERYFFGNDKYHFCFDILGEIFEHNLLIAINCFSWISNCNFEL